METDRLELQDEASHAPSPNSYEFALRGLVALGSRGDARDVAMLPPVDGLQERPAIPMDERAVTLPDVTALTEKDRKSSDVSNPNWPQSPARIQSLGVPYGNAGTTKDTTSVVYRGNHDDLRVTMGTVGSSHDASASVQQTDILDYETPAWPSTPDTIQNGYVLELLKCYRYRMAPWVSQREDCFLAGG